VVLNCGSPVSLPWLDAVPAVLLAWYPGQEGGAAITDVLVGDAEPAGRMPTTWPRQLSDTPSYQWYPGVDGTEEYGEGVLVGHRWYDAHGTDPLIPFGHGGSYTTFTWGDPRLIGDGHDVRIEVPIRNVGDRTGVEVVQVYEETSNASAKPYLMLLGFARVEIAPGAVATASILLHERSFSSYDVAARRWLLDPGTRELVVAASVADRRTRLRHVLPA
jgi:beta-glucosidase